MTAVAGASLLSLPLAAGAQTMQPTAPAPVQSTAPEPMQPAAPPAAGQTQGGTRQNFGGLISLLNNTGTQVDNVKALSGVQLSNIRLVDASSLAKGANVKALDNAVNRNNAQILNLRQVLQNVAVTDVANNNKVLTMTDALNNVSVANNLQAPVTIDRVIAVDTSGGGPITVFYR